MKKNIFAIITLSIIMFAGVATLTLNSEIAKPGNISESATPQSLESNHITNGTIPGTNISYSYGNKTFTAVGNFTAQDTGFFNESIREERLETLTLNLLNSSSFVSEKIFFEVQTFIKFNSTSNSSKVFEADNDTLMALFEAQINNSFNWYIESDVFTVDAIGITPDGEFLGKFPMNVSVLHFWNTTLGVENATWTLIPKAHVISVQKIPTLVELNITVVSLSFAWYFSYYSVKYNVQANQWFASIRDGNRIGLEVSAFKNLNLDYEELRLLRLQYFNFYHSNITIFALNGTLNDTYIPLDMFPLSLRPFFFQQNGTIDTVDARVMNMTAISASTSALQVFNARLSASADNYTLDASQRVAWLVSTTPRLIAYKDGNLDQQLNLDFNPDKGLGVSDGDIVPYIGITEAYRAKVAHFSKINHTYDQKSFGIQGFTPVNTTLINQTEVDVSFNQYNLSIGTVPGTPPNQLTYWNDPVVNDSTGAVQFQFGITYENFPVTWVNVTGGGQTTVPMNISYDYVYDLDPVNGLAKLSPTITYSSLDARPAVKAAVNGLSLAVIYKSDFLSVIKLRASRERTAPQNVTSSRSGVFGVLSFSGPETEFGTVETRGAKENYTLDGVVYQSNASILNLVTIAGAAVATNVSIFESETENVAGSAFLERTDIYAVSFQYRKDLILISYPEWNGKEIVHDPAFAAVYVPTQPEPTTTSTAVGTTSTAVGTTSETSSSSSTSPVTTEPVTGFELLSISALFVVASIVIIYRRRKLV